MKRRIFVAIDLPDDLKATICERIQQWRWLPITWQKPDNWHITIIPPIALEEGEIAALSEVLRASRLGGPFSVTFTDIVLAPQSGPSRMVWLQGEAHSELLDLRKRIEELWNGEKRLPSLKPDTRPLVLHATLARFEPGELKELEAKTKVLGEVKLVFKAADVAVMESHLLPNGAEYQTLATAAL